MAGNSQSMAIEDVGIGGWVTLPTFCCSNTYRYPDSV